MELGVGWGADKQDSRNKPLGRGKISLLYITPRVLIIVWKTYGGSLHRAVTTLMYTCIMMFGGRLTMSWLGLPSILGKRIRN